MRILIILSVCLIALPIFSAHGDIAFKGYNRNMSSGILKLNNQKELTQHLIDNDVLHKPNLINAFNKIDRANFVPDSSSPHIYDDHAMPIGYSQTISQPTVVALMLELLDPKEGERILDIGSGSGWTTALLAECVGPKGKVYGLELVPELVNFGQENLKKYNLHQATIIQAKTGILGLPNEQPFDKILISAASNFYPERLDLQFTKKLVMPIENSIWLIEKTKDKKIQKEYPGFVFVPLL